MTLHEVKLDRYFKINSFSVVFSLCWSAGILAGFGLFLIYGPSFSFQMRSAVTQPVSIIGLLFSIFLPLLCTYISVLINRPFFLLSICFIKAASFGFTLFGITEIYGTASWLFCILFTFSDIFFLFVLFLLWLRYPDCYDSKSRCPFCFSVMIGLLIVFVDYFVITPFLCGLF